MAHHDHDRNDIGREHPANHPGQIIGALLFFAVQVADNFFFRLTLIPIRNMYLQIPIAAVIIIIAVYMIRTGLTTVFEERRDPPEVISKGVFSRVRHPVYSGAMMIMLGILVTGPSGAAFGILVLNFIFYNSMASYEESLLIKMFGNEYLEYMETAGRWLPKFRKPAA
ncbi:MAG: isoprenylcysteine carboxylmethyltransferase family protein [Spirochaetales bacterium]|uniref:Isoprenylcysteine carboxylmethyltransferase family protein n=1 Tax=Candidatus Thalassospirochaeta sargassi TaxID=3119039 RepID=A0AAJ1IFP9_9SPIO|nr:isoprenylcysteine carboxylmethyltransferase family protein [Spirochaetales bacterium]